MVKLSSRQQNMVLGVCIISSSMAFIDSTALNVALPTLQNSLGLKASQTLWVVNIYNLFLASLILLGGALGDVYGKKRILSAGVFIFTLFSLLCSLAPSGLFLIIMRGFQGIGGAIMVPGSLALVTASFSDQKRGKAIGTWSMISAFTTILGPVIGGYLASLGLWRAIFLINLPLGTMALFILISYIPEPGNKSGKKIDWTGSLLVTLAFLAITYALMDASEAGFGSSLIWLILIVGNVLLLLFLIHEARTSTPLMPLTLFYSRSFSGSNLLTLFVYGALGTVLFFVPLNLIQIQGYPEEVAGFAILPFGLLIALLARTSGKYTDKFGARPFLVLGPLLTGLGFLLFTRIGITTGPTEYWQSFFPPLLISGLGMGITVVPLTTTVMNCVTETNAGIASGVNNAVARLAGLIALATIGAFMLIYFQSILSQGIEKSGLSTEKQKYMIAQGQYLGNAQPLAAWPQAEKDKTTLLVRSSFSAVFDIVAIISAALCFAGSIVALIFIRNRPVKLNIKTR